MRQILMPLILILLLAHPGLAQEIGGTGGLFTDELHLKDGTVLQGRIVEEGPDIIVLETESLGVLRIARDRLAADPTSPQESESNLDPDRNSILFCPTPETLPAGDGYFRSFELFFLNYGYAITDDFNLSVGTLFPITGDFYMLSLGGKLRLLDRAQYPLGLALTANFTGLDNYWFGSVGAVAGIGGDRRSLNLAVNHVFDEDSDAATVLMVGSDFQGPGRSKLLLELFSNSPIIGDFDDDLTGFVNVGVRLFGDDWSFSLTGFRPLWGDDDGLAILAFPMVMFSKHF